MSLFRLTPAVPFLHSNSKPVHIQTWSGPLFLSGNISYFTSLSLCIPVLIFLLFLEHPRRSFLSRKSSFRNFYATRILHLLFLSLNQFIWLVTQVRFFLVMSNLFFSKERGRYLNLFSSLMGDFHELSLEYIPFSVLFFLSISE